MTVLRMELRAWCVIVFALQWQVTGAAMAGEHQQSTVRVGIVGAGITGSSSAYFVREALEGYGDNLQLTVFESSDRLCGRMRSAWLDGKPYEVGAAVAHPKNQYLGEFVDILGGWRNIRREKILKANTLREGKE